MKNALENIQYLLIFQNNVYVLASLAMVQDITFPIEGVLKSVGVWNKKLQRT